MAGFATALSAPANTTRVRSSGRKQSLPDKFGDLGDSITGSRSVIVASGYALVSLVEWWFSIGGNTGSLQQRRLRFIGPRKCGCWGMDPGQGLRQDLEIGRAHA